MGNIIELIINDKQAFTYLLIGIMGIFLFFWSEFLERREMKHTKHPKR